MELKPIETYYNGYRFRSRLEARWAVFFDAAGVRYEYEPQGFVLPSGNKYLPDFLVHGIVGRDEGDLWIEVKGNMTGYDAARIDEFSEHYPIAIVDDIPKGETAEELWDYMTNHGFEPFCSQYKIYPFNFSTIDNDFFSFGIMATGDGGLRLCGADSSYFYGFDDDVTVNAYMRARRARFEHGETP